MRRTVAVLAVASTVLAGALVAGILIPPALPGFSASLRAGGALASLPRIATTRSERQRLAARARLFASVGQRIAEAKHAVLLPLRATTIRATPPGRAVTAGFFVNWDDNSFVSLRAHASRLDWVVCEWLFLNPVNDSLRSRVDRRVLYLRQSLPAAERPNVLAMLTNYDSAHADFDPCTTKACYQ